jgi:glutamate 5-kinase
MNYQRIVVKLGTATLMGGAARLSPSSIFDLVRQVVKLRQEGSQVVLVSSGAIAAGREVLGFPDLPRFIPAKQMLAAVGQPRLMGLYEQFFGMYNEKIAQVLLTRADIADRRRYLNARDTLDALLAQNIIPIINENDTVATEEIRFGDNDALSAQVANLVEADLLVILTDQAGLFTDDPRRDANAQLIATVEPPDIPEELWRAAGGSSSGLGTGGMATKLLAADLARRSGTTVVIAGGKETDVLLRVAARKAVGTRLTPVVTKLESRKRYILAGRNTAGMLVIDDGAVHALAQGGSLLPVGVIRVEGDFERGDTVRVSASAGKEIAVGLVNYPAKDLTSLCRRQSSEIESILGYTLGDEVIHRNNMFLL